MTDTLIRPYNLTPEATKFEITGQLLTDDAFIFDKTYDLELDTYVYTLTLTPTDEYQLNMFESMKRRSMLSIETTNDQIYGKPRDMTVNAKRGPGIVVFKSIYAPLKITGANPGDDLRYLNVTIKGYLYNLNNGEVHAHASYIDFAPPFDREALLEHFKVDDTYDFWA